MSETTSAPAAGRDEVHADLFAELVVQHANMALIFVGAVPHPETGEPVQDLEAAQLFIDRLDMLEAKTRGNLSAQETALLKQSLTAARMAFVQAVERDGKAENKPPSATPTPAAIEPAPAPDPATAATSAEDERKKFVKKY